MKPLAVEIQDDGVLQDLGRASVQIVHDIKNQLNGLKLYATFLRKRMEKHERPEDERETVAKLIAGLERAAADMTTLVRYGRPLELRPQKGVTLNKLLAAVAPGDEAQALIELELEEGSFEGEFDPAALTEALQAITAGALKMRRAGDRAVSIHLTGNGDGHALQALIEWRGIQTPDTENVFRSFAGSEALRLSLAAKIIEAHQGITEQRADALCVRLPVKSRGDG